MRGGYGALAIAIATAVWGQPTPSAIDPITGPQLGKHPMQSMHLRGMGFSAAIALGEQQGPGCYPVQVTLDGIGIAPADRHLTFRIATNQGEEYPQRNGLIVDVPVTMPQGAQSVSVTRYLPKWTLGHNIVATLIADGQPLDDSTTPVASDRTVLPLKQQANRWTSGSRYDLAALGLERELRQDWLYIGNDRKLSATELPDFDSMIVNQPGRSKLVGAPGETSVRPASSRWLHGIGQQSLPRDWRGYQPHDVVVIESAGLTRVAADRKAREALREWILQGGTTIVYGVTDSGAELAKLRFKHASDSQYRARMTAWLSQRQRGLLGVQKRLSEIIQQLTDLSSKPQQAEQIEQMISQQVALLYEDDIDVYPDLSNPQASIGRYKGYQTQIAAAIGRINPSIADHVDVSLPGAGLVATIKAAAADPTTGSPLPPPVVWQMVKSLADERCSAMVRMGVEPIRGNRRFQQWTVPGVLQPPVYSFIGLLTVFVFLVGPIAYRQTSRHGRSHFMFAIAPLLALVTTLAMFGYGIVADGFGTRVRLRQLTWVDGHSGDAGERVRATYFAGIRPREGLIFPGAAIVMRQAEENQLTWEESIALPPASLGKVTVTDTVQAFDSSFLPSRDQRQFITHCPRSNVGTVRLSHQQSQESSQPVESTFGFPLHHLIARDATGQYWLARQVAAGQTTTAELIDARSASKLLGTLYNDHRPIAEAIGVTPQRRNQTNRRFRFDLLHAVTTEVSTRPDIASGLFEDWLQTNLQTRGELPPGYFVATAEVSEDVIAVKGGEVVESIRYLFGTLR